MCVYVTMSRENHYGSEVCVSVYKDFSCACVWVPSYLWVVATFDLPHFIAFIVGLFMIECVCVRAHIKLKFANHSSLSCWWFQVYIISMYIIILSLSLSSLL